MTVEEWKAEREKFYDPFTFQVNQGSDFLEEQSGWADRGFSPDYKVVAVRAYDGDPGALYLLLDRGTEIDWDNDGLAGFQACVGALIVEWSDGAFSEVLRKLPQGKRGRLRHCLLYRDDRKKNLRKYPKVTDLIL